VAIACASDRLCLQLVPSLASWLLRGENQPGMTKKALSEADICAKCITPAVV
jgi:hypothetical protein